MSKIVKSTIKKFPGSVTFYEPLTFPMVKTFEDAIQITRELEGDNNRLERDEVLLPAICSCVEEWGLEGLGDLTPETFPGAPRIASAQLVAWLIGEILEMYTESEEVPNE